MTHVATLVCSPAAPILDAALLTRARAALPHAEAPRWLDGAIAADIPFSAGAENDNRRLAEEVRAALAGAPVDVVVQGAAGRRKKLFLADMDSTMIGQECIDELADFVGRKQHVAAITERAMRGELAFAPALRERVAALKGLPSSVVEEVIRDRLTLTPGGRVLVATMRAHGAHACLVSGGFTLFTKRIAAMIGFDEARANTLVLAADGTFAGEVVEPIFSREGKLATLIELRSRFGLAREETLVAGDGANDIAMIEEAGLGIAYRAKPAVAAAAHARIEHADLTALLYAQGYRREEFVAV
jgi:phosphoserine phosphatase